MEQIVANKNCEKCGGDFELTNVDLEFYKTLEIPAPTFCPDCRQQRRLTWRNERTLYKRKCDATGKEIISVFHSDRPFPVYDNDYWYSDKWDALSYGRDFDFSRPFFEQFKELFHSVPQLARSAVGNHNCDYVNQCGWCKNCYLIFEADFDENCLYSNNIYDSKSCMDIYHGTKNELCYECINCQNSYNLKYSQDCKNCSDSLFLESCIGCKNCFGSVNLRNKQYYFLNEKYSKEEYFEKLKTIPLGTYQTVEDYRIKFHDFARSFPHRYMHGVQNENSTGDYLDNTQNCQNCFNIQEAQDCKFVFDSRNTKKVYDMSVFGSQKTTEFCCDNHEIGYGIRNVCFSDQVWNGCYNVYYSKMCIDNCHDLFGCVGLKHKEYCILNKQYSKDEYEDLRAKIVEHMQVPASAGGGKQTGQYGQFFPTALSPFYYNETTANDYFPLNKDEAMKNNFSWRDLDPKELRPQNYVIPANIEEVPDSILNEVLACLLCKKNYKIVKEELNFYRNQNLPVPLKCHDCRHKYRFNLRNKRHLFNSECDKCSEKFKTTFNKEETKTPIYCDKCYLQSLD